MIWHDLHLDPLSLTLGGNLTNNSFQTIINAALKRLTTILGTPDDMVGASIYHIAVGMKRWFHMGRIPRRAPYGQARPSSAQTPKPL